MEKEKLRELQLVENEMLKDTVEICKKHHIQYYLISGTLLGAVRHKGFIPWDDDIDIIMFYPDYTRFLKVAQEELGDRYFVQTSETDPAWYRAYATIRKNGTTLSYPHMLKWSTIHQGIWLDVFPVTWMKNIIEVKIKRRALQIANYLAMDEYMVNNIDEFRGLFGLAWPFLQLFYKIPEQLRKKWRKKLTTWIFGKKTTGKYVVQIWTGITHGNVYPGNAFSGPPDIVEFEGNEYNAPYDTNHVLSTNYGPDYMQPRIEDKGHEELILDFNKSYLEYRNNEV